MKEQVRNYDLIDVVMVCLGGEGQENYNGVLKLLDVLLSPKAGEAKKRQVLQNEFDIPMTETLEAEVHQMCNLSEGVRDLGRVERILDSVRNLMASMGWSAERAMDALRLSDDDRAKCAGLLQNQ